jgi:hypothetical protein
VHMDGWRQVAGARLVSWVRHSPFQGSNAVMPQERVAQGWLGTGGVGHWPTQWPCLAGPLGTSYVGGQGLATALRAKADLRRVPQ